MAVVVTVRHQVAVAGRVADAQTSQPLAGALVLITTGPVAWMDQLARLAAVYGAAWATLSKRPDWRETAEDGHFHFLDLPDGTCQMTASMPGAGRRYGSAQVQAAVARDANGNITMAAADLTLPPTTIIGRITDPSAAPVKMAAVRVKGSGETTYSDAQGHYRLTEIETGTRTLQVSAQGFQLAAQTVVLASPGTTQTVNFSLVAA
jgi:hypothetical protein